MASNIVTIPREMANKGELVLVPRSEYEEFLRLRRKIKLEKQDTDEAIRIFEKERKEGKLSKIKSLADFR